MNKHHDLPSNPNPIRITILPIRILCITLDHLGLARLLQEFSMTGSLKDPHKDVAWCPNLNPNPIPFFLPTLRWLPDSSPEKEEVDEDEELIRRSSCVVIHSISYISRSVIAGEEGDVFIGDARRWPEGRGDGGGVPAPARLYQASAAAFTRAFGLELDSISWKRDELKRWGIN